MSDNSQGRHQDWQRTRLWQIQAVRDVFFIAAVIALAYLGFVLSVVTIPLLLGLGLAYLIEPVLGWLQRRWSWATRPRVLSCMVIVCLLVGAFVLLLTVPRIISQGE